MYFKVSIAITTYYPDLPEHHGLVIILGIYKFTVPSYCRRVQCESGSDWSVLSFICTYLVLRKEEQFLYDHTGRAVKFVAVLSSLKCHKKNEILKLC